MYYLEEALKAIRGTDNDAVCVEGESRESKLFYVDNILHCEEPDGTSYTCREDSVPDHLIWFITKEE